MGICKDINTNFCHLYIFVKLTEKKGILFVPYKQTYLEMLRMFFDYRVIALEQLLLHFRLPNELRNGFVHKMQDQFIL